MDIDLLGRTDNGIDVIVKLMREVAEFDVPDDGISFDSASFSGAAIREDADYAGVRTVFLGTVPASTCRLILGLETW